MTTRELLHEKRDEILALAAKHKAHNVRVFGSVARGDEGPERDVDLLVDFEDHASLFDQIGLQQDLEELLGRQTDVVEDGFVHWVIRDQVAREARSLHELTASADLAHAPRRGNAKSDHLSLVRMRESLERLAELATEGEAAFLQDRTTQDAVLFRVGDVGSRALHVSGSTRRLARDVPWDDLIRSGHQVLDHYDAPDLTAVWRTAESAQDLIARVNDLLGSLPTLKER